MLCANAEKCGNSVRKRKTLPGYYKYCFECHKAGRRAKGSQGIMQLCVCGRRKYNSNLNSECADCRFMPAHVRESTKPLDPYPRFSEGKVDG